MSKSLAALLGFVVVIAAYVALTVTHNDTTNLLTIVVTLAGLFGLGIHAEARTQEQNKVIHRIAKQTNGVLDERIRTQAKAALAEALTEVIAAQAENSAGAPLSEVHVHVPPGPPGPAGKPGPAGPTGPAHRRHA